MRTLPVVDGQAVGEIKPGEFAVIDGNTCTVYERGDARPPPRYTAEQIAAMDAQAQADAAQERTDAQAARAMLTNMLAGQGTVDARLQRLERVLYFIARRTLRELIGP